MTSGSARYRTAGGWFVEPDLPLSVAMQRQIERGELQRVDADGNPIPEHVVAVPPRTGKGSGRDQWAAYAAAHDVHVPEDASRDDILAALIEAGLIEAE
jgi:hypothetical protein